MKIKEDYQYFNGEHPAIIDLDIFKAVQEFIKSNKKKRIPEHRLLFTGVTYCECGSKLQSHKRDRWYSYYCKTCNKYISENKLEKFIINKLLTLKGLECIRKADVIVYDRLANINYLKEAKKGCEFINVGKASSDHLVPQDQINRIIADKALE